MADHSRGAHLLGLFGDRGAPSEKHVTHRHNLMRAGFNRTIRPVQRSSGYAYHVGMEIYAPPDYLAHFLVPNACQKVGKIVVT